MRNLIQRHVDRLRPRNRIIAELAGAVVVVEAAKENCATRRH